MAFITDDEIERIQDKTLTELARGAAAVGYGKPGASERERMIQFVKDFKDGHARLLCLRKWIREGKVQEVNTIKMDKQCFRVGDEEFTWGHDVQFPPMTTFAHMALSVQFNRGTSDETI